MPLNSGEKLGPYEVVAPLGAGGMGEVYRARDTRLGRDVAIKILPKEMSADPVRKQRFEREAKTISGLNHPNICVLHDVGSQDGVDYLVMECVEGETLAERLKKGPLPVEQVLRYGAQIADALDKAHRSGVVHRDLKPGNIMLTKTGAKLLDFGLARPTATSTASLATLTNAAPASPMTQEGVIVGTFQYMSPEQVEGKEVDGRSDIFSLGAVLYEMVTGKRAFEGKSQLSVASAILEKEPEPISAVQPPTPVALDRTIRKCLAKRPDERWQSASDLATQLSWMGESSASGMAARPVAGGRDWRWLGWALSGLLMLLGIGAVGMWMNRHGEAKPSRVMRLSIVLPAGDALGGSWWWYPGMAVSAGGTQIAYVAHHGGQSQIYVRAIGETGARAVAGSEGADTPFFSPDGQWLGMYGGGKIKKVPLGGGPTVTVASTGAAGACWGADDTIFFGGRGGLMKVAASGGEPQVITKLDEKNHERSQIYPELLPGGKSLLFTVRTAEQPSYDEADIAAVRLGSGERKILVKGGTNPHYVEGGYLVFIRAGVLMAAGFDAEKLELKGTPVPVAENILENPRIGAGQYAISKDGLLVYIPGGVTYGEHELVFVDKAGNAKPLTAKKRPYEDFTISPDGKFIATTIEGPVTNTWLHDIARDTETRFNSGVEDRDPTWTPDGKRVAYSSYKDGKDAVLWKPLDGGPEEVLMTSENMVYAWFFSPDGRGLLYAEVGKERGQNVGMLPLDNREHGKLVFPPEYNVEWAILSPDGKWIAFDSNESGKTEVYVAPYPAIAPRERISTDGGLHPLWAPDMKELYYRSGASVEGMEQRALAQKSREMAVSIETKPAFKAGQPRMLFEGPYFKSGHDIAVTPDGKGFVLIRESDVQTGPGEIGVVVNWAEELRQRVK
jgi:Tol biopolymer transport system component